MVCMILSKSFNDYLIYVPFIQLDISKLPKFELSACYSKIDEIKEAKEGMRSCLSVLSHRINK